MVTFKINGSQIQTDLDKSLLPFLRDDMGIKSVKNGCSEGACGTCRVLIDGMSKNACTQELQNLEGKTILTVDGLSDYEKEVYAYSFASTGAVQCGFCIPGMVISAKALLDKKATPTEKDVAKALVGNICRCTGYKKIIEAILLAAEYIKENKPVPSSENSPRILDDIFRIDATTKTLGTGKYVDDLEFPDMVFASAIRSKYPRAIVDDIDITGAISHPDTIAIITADDIPGNNKSGHIVKDWDTFIAQGDTTRYIGDSIALVVSEKESSLNEIKKLVNIKYTPLRPITSPSMTLEKNAPLLHENGNVLRHDSVKRGENVEEVIKKSKHVVHHVYNTPFTEHAFMEPECAVCSSDGETLTLHTSSQSIYDEQREIAHILGIDIEKIHIISALVGGAFGGKEDMSVQHHAALASYITKKTVKVKLSRQESINVHPKRHAMEIDLTTACDEDGMLTGIKARITSDTGAYASLGGPVLQRACTHAGGPYQYSSVDIKGKAVYTNNPPAGAFRGFGVPQSMFAIESNINLLAEKVGISPWEIRYRNAIKPNGVLPNGQIADCTTALQECLLELKDVYDSHKNVGIAASFKSNGFGVGVPDTGRCILSIENSKIHIRTSAARVGQGLDTVLQQMASQTLDMPPEMIIVEKPDTRRTPNSGTTTASRQTLFTGQAMITACEQLKKRLDEGATIDQLEQEEYYGEYSCKTDPIDSAKENPFSHVAYGYGAQVVVLDDNGKANKIYAAYDAGKIINKKSAEGQVEGGIVMGLGYALTENYVLIDCVPQQTYAKLGLFRANAVPYMNVVFVNKNVRTNLAYGTKGIGEISSIPTAPAVAGAYLKFDGIHRTKLPLENTAYRK
ncbi:MAG: selenium-dependent xanthine dehydrogenase [Clostridiales bacterium]|nr:selenium-dependent xanthine dehydrogenase [Clostridiales bacterium]